MGPAHTSPPPVDLLAILAQKDRQIAELDLQVEAYVSRTSKLQIRLTATLDALDELKQQQHEELRAVQLSRKALDVKLRLSEHAREAVEAERDSLRDAVLQLIEKVEVCNDFALWPHSGMFSTGLVAPSKLPGEPGQPHDPTAAFHAYATSTISALRANYEAEKAAHAHTRADASHRIARLEAQLARREAELEASIAPHRAAPTSASPPPYKSTAAPRTDTLSQADAIRILEQSAARNRGLKREVEGLLGRLEDARAAASPPAPDPSPQVLSKRKRDGAANPRLHPLARPSSATSAHGHDLGSASADDRPHQATDASAEALRAIDRQIDALQLDLHSLEAERHRAQRAASLTSRGHPIPQYTPREFNEILVIEEECIRLRKAEREAHRELETLGTVTRQRESDLRDEIARLQRRSPRAAPAAVVQEDAFADDEQSMELATPLQPTLLLSQPPGVDPPLIPLPASPEVRPSADDSPALPLLDLDTADLDRARITLDHLQNELRDKDAELAKLREELMELRSREAGERG
ncbi:hypothetical protein BV25DRAFT_1993065 [Artomyces pyxidatus]|uniref:Uncharacterized protein n=1 Tax=Artomyces pyxidatus TaxID=48021 RepID=A0ACB8SUJ1_9AGAM|nr:hypothetical protein BV25DRAFT_1993065 [Artomyces pyxidatus]